VIFSAALFAVVASALPPQPTDELMLAGMLAQGAAIDLRSDVLTSADLRNALDLEAQKQVASCNDEASCLAEIAQALDAHIVLSGNIQRRSGELIGI